MNIGWGQRVVIVVVGRLLFGDLPRVLKDAVSAMRVIAGEVKGMQGVERDSAKDTQGVKRDESSKANQQPGHGDQDKS